MTINAGQASETDKAYAAGFFDGEGSCAFHNGGLQVSVTQNDRECLDKLRRFFGGKVTGPNYDKTNELSDNPRYAWWIFGPRAHGFLMTIFSLLSKRRQKQTKGAIDAYCVTA